MSSSFYWYIMMYIMVGVITDKVVRSSVDTSGLGSITSVILSVEIFRV